MPGVNQTTSAPPAAPGGPPTALRLRNPSWRDPRLWVGVALVLVSVVAGARLLASADDTVGVWSASSDLTDIHPITGRALPRAAWWLIEVKE